MSRRCDDLGAAYRIKVPLLLGGPHAAALQPLLATLGFAASVASDRLGVASATKMCHQRDDQGAWRRWSSSFTAARHYGVEDAVIASLQETFPGIDAGRNGRATSSSA